MASRLTAAGTRRAGRRAGWLVAAGLVLGTLAPIGAQASAQTPVVTDNGATTVYDDGALLTGNVNSGGDTVLATVSYGVAGSTQTTPMYWNQPAANGNVSVAVSQLAPGTTYTYQWEVWDQNTGNTTTGPSGTFTTGNLPTGAAAPIVPPNNPPANGIFQSCGSDPECLADINGVRAAQENLQPLVLPTNWAGLTGAEQIFVWSDMERVSRDESPITDLVNTYDRNVQAAVTTDADPVIPRPGGNLGVWAGADATPLGAMYGWMYADGLGNGTSGNLACTTPNAPGCWGHRDNLLSDALTYGNPNEMDAVAGTDASGSPSYAAAMWNDNGTTPAAANVVMTWASEQPYLTTTAPTAPPPGNDIVSTENCGHCTPPLTYNGGPVLGNDGNPITVTPIFWVPPGYNLPTGTYQSIIDRYLTDVAADSGTSTNVFSIATEYGGTLDGATAPINYQIAYNGDQTDTDPYPTTANCAVPNGFTACLTDTQMRAELTSYLAAKNLPEDMDHIYPVFFPAGVANAFSTTDAFPANYCAYHYYIRNGASTVLWANEPAPTATLCNTGQAPNGDGIADSEISTLSHELMETITDPLVNAWYDTNMNEIGDECAWTFGTPVGSTGTPGTSNYNQVINGDDYYVQEMFSNHGFATSPNQACLQGEAQVAQGATGATANAALRAAARREQPDSVAVTAAHQAMGGGKRTTVTVHVGNPSGAPVAGDHVMIDLTADTYQTGACGTVAPDHGFTDAAGDFTTTYTAASESTECTVIAIEAATGQHGMTTLYLGRDQLLAPKITYSAPRTLVVGHSASITATVTNPVDQIGDTQDEVVIAGGGSGRSGLTASEVRLSYRSGRSGRWTTVPLSGGTRDGGSITGDLTAVPEMMAAHSISHLEFRIELVQSPCAGPLTFGLAVNQMDTASDSADVMAGSTVTLGVRR